MNRDDLLARAQAAHRAGDAAGAEPLYRELLAANPDDVEPLYAFGVLLAQTRRMAESLQVLERAARLAPGDGRIGRNLALVLQAAGRPDRAEREFLRLREREPDRPEHCFGLALAVSAQGRHDEAVGHFRAGLALAPGDVEARCNLGLACRAAGRLDEAIEAFSLAAAQAPAMAKAHGNLGGALFAAGRWAEAAAAWERALELEPGHADVRADMGVALANLGRTEEASDCFRQASALDPANPAHPYNLGRALHDLGRLDEALESYGRVLALDPGHASAHLNRGVILRRLGNAQAALAAYDRAVALAPGNANAHMSRAKALSDLGRAEEALAACRRVLDLRPQDAEAFSEAVYLRRQLCDWDGVEADEEAVRALVRSGADGVDPFIFLAISSTQAEQLACASRWAVDFEARAAGAGRLPPLAPCSAAGAGRPVRVGYLSADFREHPVAYLVADLLERHDRARFEVFAYSYGPDDRSSARRRLEAAVDRFADIRGVGLLAAAQRIRADGVDILVDLTGYTKHTRTDILALRPAPVQVNYLGYAGSLGAGFADYIVADPIILPMTEQDNVAERIVHLPHSYLPSDPGRPMPGPAGGRAEWGLPEDAFVFCAFHQFYKITPAVFAVWLRLLAEVPDSVLWLLDGAAAGRDSLRRRARSAGIDPARLIFAPRVDIAGYLARHRLADLFLDTQPYNAHGSAADALWMGLPLVTCLGTAFPGRVAAGVMRAAGLPDLVAGSLEEYGRLALDLAQDRTRLGLVRRRLEEERGRVPLFDNARFTRDLERAYDRMAGRARAGLPPEPFAV